jgi:hypothetical protein
MVKVKSVPDPLPLTQSGTLDSQVDAQQMRSLGICLFLLVRGQVVLQVVFL